MPFNWRGMLPYGLGRLIPNPAATPAPAAAPAAPIAINPATGGIALPEASSGYAGTGWADYANPPAPTAAAVQAAPMAPVQALAPAPSYGNPLATSAPTSINPFSGIGNTISGAFSPGGIFGDAPGGGRPNTGGAGGIFGGVAPWSAAGVANSAAAQNPGSTGTAAADLSQAPVVSQLNRHAI